MSTISRPPPSLPDSIFITPPISWGESVDTEAAALICLMICDFAKPVSKRFRIAVPSARLAADIHARHGLQLYINCEGSLFVFPDFSAVFVSPEEGGVQSLYPRPLSVTRLLRAVKSSVSYKFNEPLGLFRAAAQDEKIAQNIDKTLRAVATDWERHPEFDIHYKAGGCDIPWVSTIKVSEDYQFILDEINRAARTFEAYAGTRIENVWGCFRSILSSGELSPLTVEARFLDAPHATRKTLALKFTQWMSYSMSQNPEQQVCVLKDMSGRPTPRAFRAPKSEVTAHEIMERMAEIRALFGDVP